MSPKQWFKASIAWCVLSYRLGPTKFNWDAVQKFAVYPNLRIAYNRIKKNANTTTVILLREMETGLVEDRERAKNNSQSPISLNISSIFSLRDCFFFIVIRNPYSRVLSAFLEKFRLEQYRREHGEFLLTREGFAEFVAWLANGGLTKDRHWNLQSDQMFLPLDKYDFVVEFDSFATGMKVVFDRTGLRPPEDRLNRLYPSDVNKLTGASSLIEEFYTVETASLVARLYRKDFESLGYGFDLPNSKHRAMPSM
jgi:hypothetical protein